MQTVYNPIENKLQPLNNFQIDIISNNDKTIKDLIMKYSELCTKENENFLGDTRIENFQEFCNGDLDVKTLKKEKKLESSEITEKYFNKFRYNFKSKIQINPKINLEEIQNEEFSDLNYDISHWYENSNENKANDNYIQQNESNDNHNLNLDKKMIDGYEIEMQYCINESIKLQQQKQIKKVSFDKSVNDELREIMKIKESLMAEENNGLMKINNSNNSAINNSKISINFPKTPEIKKLSTPVKFNEFINQENEKSTGKNIKSLFDILEKEKEINFLSSNPVIESPLK